MSTQFIVLTVDTQAQILNYALWADVPSTRQSFYASAGAVSAYSGATTQENTAIASGAVAETAGSMNYAGMTQAAIAADLESRALAWQQQVNTLNPGRFYGTRGVFNGTSWTVTQAGVA